jgi:Concanavalin A-like lectin/glucanases superfamily
MFIGQGVQLTGGVQIISEANPVPYVTNGLVMNLLTAPSSGTTWTDATGNGNNATIITSGSGTATYTSNYGGGITLGTALNSEAICTAYNLGTSFTVEMWAQPTAANYWATLWGNDIYSTKGYWAYWSSSASGISAGSPSGSILYSGITPNPGAIKHYVFTLTGSTFTAYLNGVAQSGTGSFSGPTGGVSTTGLNFGSRHPNTTGTANTPTDVCAGTYYQMRVYNRALSSSEVTQNFNGSRGIFGI